MSKKFVHHKKDAGSYFKLGIKGTTYEPSFSTAATMLDNISEQTFLDFGSGAGRSACFLKELGAQHVVGVDHNESMTTMANQQTDS